MSKLEEVDPVVTAAFNDLRKDNSPTNWVLCGFESEESSSKLVLLGSGAGGISELSARVPENDVAYGVVRKIFEYDTTGGAMGATQVTKFIRVCWRPESKMSMKRKMKIGPLDGAIKKVLGATHADIDTESKDEISETALVHLIERITQKADMTASAAGKQASTFFNGGVASNARNAVSDSHAAKAKQDGYLDTNNLTGSAKGAEVEFDDIDAIKAAIQTVRENKDPTTWCLTGYRDKKHIELLGTGTGDVSELLAACKDQTVCYGIFRVTEQIDKTTAIKFCFLVWQPEDVPVMIRAAISTHKGTVTPLFRPYHVDFQATTRTELTHEVVMDHIMGLSGTKSHVSDKAPQQKVDVYERKMLGGVKAEEVVVEFTDQEALVNAIKLVRNDKSDVTWAVASWDIDGKSVKLAFRSSGSGDAEPFRDALCVDPANVSYGILRTKQVVDMSTVVKFIFVVYQGPDLAPLVKAKVSTLRGGVVPIFHPYHAEMFIDSANELTNSAVDARLK
jgi:hypothetical protein